MIKPLTAKGMKNKVFNIYDRIDEIMWRDSGGPDGRVGMKMIKMPCCKCIKNFNKIYIIIKEMGRVRKVAQGVEALALHNLQSMFDSQIPG